jgi:hypothetical protein
VRPLKWFSLLSVFLLVLCACAAPHSTAKYSTHGVQLPPGTLGPSEVTALFFNKTVKSRNKGGNVSQTYYSPNGTLKQIRDGQVRTGTWKVRPDGRICLTMAGEKGQCRYILKKNDQYRKFKLTKKGKAKKVVTYLSFQSGNQIGK